VVVVVLNKRTKKLAENLRKRGRRGRRGRRGGWGVRLWRR
jgi:hypothetical protein